MSNPAVTIRSATPADLKRVVAFNAALAVESEGKELDVGTLTAGVAEALSDPNRCLYFMAEIGTVVVGQTMITVEWSDWRNGWFWWIQSVFVDPAFRRRGVFRALYEHIRADARARPDVCGIRLYVHRENRRAIETYSNLGLALSDYRLCEHDWSTH